jgi:hypothetical protein
VLPKPLTTSMNGGGGGRGGRLSLCSIMFYQLSPVSVSVSFSHVSCFFTGLSFCMSAALTTLLNLIHSLIDLFPHLARYHPHSARFHPHSARFHPQLGYLIHARLDLIHTRLDLIRIKLAWVLLSAPFCEQFLATK